MPRQNVCPTKGFATPLLLWCVYVVREPTSHHETSLFNPPVVGYMSLFWWTMRLAGWFISCVAFDGQLKIYSHCKCRSFTYNIILNVLAGKYYLEPPLHPPQKKNNNNNNIAYWWHTPTIYIIIRTDAFRFHLLSSRRKWSKCRSNAIVTLLLCV